ncbi:MAG: N-acetyltransferase family protein [Rhodothermales bacterium]
MIIRTAVTADAERIAGIYSHAILARNSTMETEPVSGNTMAARLDALGSRETVLVAVDDHTGVVGWGIVKAWSDRVGYRVACETSVYLDPDWTSRGIGSRIQQALFGFCRSAGYHHVAVKIWADNAHSLAMHRKNGFELVGIQREIGLVDGVWRDVAIMQCLLD